MNRLWVAAFLLSVPATAIAHHGWSSYDASKTMKITAPLTDVRWGNPHGSAKLTWQKRAWDVVLAPVARMERRGLSKDMLSDGKRVTLEGYPRRDGAAEMRIERITAHGKTVELR